MKRKPSRFIITLLNEVKKIELKEPPKLSKLFTKCKHNDKNFNGVCPKCLKENNLTIVDNGNDKDSKA